MSSLSKPEGPESSWLSLVARQVHSLRFGVVQIVVHDSHVVQIERTEKVRLDREDRQLSPISEPTAPPDSRLLKTNRPGTE
jgi:hypothetical protein